MMAAALAEGTTVIENAAKEPEIDDLAKALNARAGRFTAPVPMWFRSTVSALCMR